MNNENCHLVYGIDQKYVPPALVSIYSAIRSASGPLKITVFMTEDNAESIRYFQFLEKRFPENRIELSHFDPSPFEEYDRTRPHHWAAASMIPLFVPWLLEGTCIVLDADTVILDDITHLSQEDLRGNPLAACQASSVAVTTEKYFTFNLNRMVRPFYSRKRKQKICEWSRRVGFSIDELKTKYCASGVHVMRTDVIRKMDPKRDLANVEASRKHWNSMPDMDRYNEVFKDKTHLLDLRWNVYRDFNPINRMYVSLVICGNVFWPRNRILPFSITRICLRAKCGNAHGGRHEDAIRFTGKCAWISKVIPVFRFSVCWTIRSSSERVQVPAFCLVNCLSRVSSLGAGLFLIKVSFWSLR